MEFLLRRKNRIWVIVVFWLLLAVLLTTKSTLGQIHKFGTGFWIQNFFFQGSGAFIWMLFTPLIIRHTKRFDFSTGSISNVLLAHLVLSFPLALIHRALALVVDFGLRSLVNMEFFDVWNPFSIIFNFRFVIFESSITSFVTYWILVIVFTAILSYKRAKQRSTKSNSVAIVKDMVDQFKVKVDGVYKLISIENIISCEASGNYVNLHTAEGEYRIRETMNQLENKLGFPFIRIHRSSIVNVNYLESFEHLYQGEYLIKLQNGRQLTSTRGYRENLQPVLTKT